MKRTALMASGYRKLQVKLLNGETLDFTRKPWNNALTLAIQSKGEPDEGESLSAFRARSVLPFIHEWDVFEEDGRTRVDPSVEILEQLDIRDLLALDSAISEDLLPPGRATSETSDAGSLPVETSAPVRIGTSNSSMLSDSE